MATEELARYPSKGKRRDLDGRWLTLLHRDGLRPYLVDVDPPPELGRAVEEFNQGQYWHCHETLERIWLRENYPVRLFYHGLIKAAVGLLHLKRRNHHGALVMLQDAGYALIPFLPQFMGIDTQKLHGDVLDRIGVLDTEGLADWKAISGLPSVQINPHCF